jgi:Tol biopolymer transport system component
MAARVECAVDRGLCATALIHHYLETMSHPIQFRILPVLGALTGLPAPAPGQTSAPAAELFGVGIISTRENELNAAFTPDGRTLYITRKVGDGGRFAVILESRVLPTGRWSDPSVASFSGRYGDYDPIVSPDGSQLFFISYRPVTGDAPRRDLDIWVVERSGTTWGTPTNLGAPINTEGDELYPSVASDGTLYFSSCGRSDSKGRCDLYRARKEGGRYLAPEQLGDSVNTAASETDAFVAPDQSYLIFAAYGRPDAIGDGDLYVSFNRSGTWSAPRNLGPLINTVAREYCPIVSPDGQYFYFTSQRGFTDSPPARPYTYPQLREAMGSVRNGFGDIYRVPIAAVLNPGGRP